MAVIGPQDGNSVLRIVPRGCGRCGACRFLARRGIENFEIARDGVRSVTRFDGAGVGGVHPGEPSGGIARPYRRGQRLEEPRNRVDLVCVICCREGCGAIGGDDARRRTNPRKS